jgi:hypothetical protein
MPRKSRIDAAGALHHIIARGIDRSKIFQDPTDKRNFLKRLADILVEKGIALLLGKPAWQNYRAE